MKKTRLQSKADLPPGYDFSGYATRYGVLCDDGRTIQVGAFSHQAGEKVPLVWEHKHGDPGNVVGHAFMFPDDVGVYAYGYFNETDGGETTKALVHGGDIDDLSIYANDVDESMVGPHKRSVHKAFIREISVVIAGSNKAANIDQVYHGGFFDEEEMIIQTNDGAVILHTEEADETPEKTEEVEETLGSVIASFNEEQMSFLKVALAAATVDEDTLDDILAKSEPPEDGEKTMGEVYDSLSPIQQSALHTVVGIATLSSDDGDEGEQSMPQDNVTHSIFDNDDGQHGEAIISHAAIAEIVSDAIDNKASLRDTFIEHAGTYGIDNIELLFPDAQKVDGSAPYLKTHKMGWVKKVMAHVHKSPFSRIKSVYADITADEARAKGYIKGNQKLDEVFPVLSRVTTPQMVYKRQKLDRGDIIEITDFDVVSWMKGEMRMKIEEELARAILVGDGRSVVDPDKINPEHIRPIYSDADIYAAKVTFPSNAGALDMVDTITESRSLYRGSGSPILYCTTEFLNTMLLVRDTNNRRIYETEQALAAALRVSEIVEVSVMENHVRRNDADTHDLELCGIVTNLGDYTLGATAGGQMSFFEQFDIDFNQQKYLYETQVSGALVRPEAAIVFELELAA